MKKALCIRNTFELKFGEKKKNCFRENKSFSKKIITKPLTLCPFFFLVLSFLVPSLFHPTLFSISYSFSLLPLFLSQSPPGMSCPPTLFVFFFLKLYTHMLSLSLSSLLLSLLRKTNKVFLPLGTQHNRLPHFCHIAVAVVVEVVRLIAIPPSTSRRPRFTKQSAHLRGRFQPRSLFLLTI